MLFTRRNRARTDGLIYCHDECDPTLAPSNIKRKRRQVKRQERQAWKKEDPSG